MNAESRAVARRLRQGADQLRAKLSAEQVDRLMEYLELLCKWNRTYNLTGIRDPLQMVQLNLLDSLSIAHLISGETVIDIGTGAGFPGLVLAICQPQRSFILLDSNGKKTRFLVQSVGALELENVLVVNQRAENFQSDQQIDIVVTRAFSSLDQSLSWFGHLLTTENRWLAMKGGVPQDEIDSLPEDFQLRNLHAVTIPGEDHSRHVLEIVRRDR